MKTIDKCYSITVGTRRTHRKKKCNMKTTLFVNYHEEFISGGEVCKGQENDSWPNYEDTIQRFVVDNISLERITPYNEQVVVDLPESFPACLFVAVVHYSDGGTFSRTIGYGSIEGVYATYDEAKQRIGDLEFKDAPSIHGYKRWEGYFSRLEDTEVVVANLITK